MKRIFFFIICAFLMNNINAQEKKFDITGNWLGVINAGTAKLRVVVKFPANDSLRVKATLDSPDQGARDIKVTGYYVKKDTLWFEVKSIQGIYKGIINADSMTIKGTWRQISYELPLNFKKVDSINTGKPQEPKRPYPYKEEEVKFKNKNNTQLAGTLTFPKEGSNFPAVILITGSGPQDRDETIFGHKPFLIISDFLTRMGFAVLRYDDRGIGESKGDFSKATTLDFTDDALAAVDFLKTRNEIDQKKIGLIGHSEGGLIAPLASTKSKDVAFIVLLAGPGETGEKIILSQSALIAKVEGVSAEKMAKDRKLSASVYKAIKTIKNNIELQRKINLLYTDYFNTLSDSEKTPNTLQAYKQQGMFLTSPWFKFFLTYDPVPVLKKVKIPVLALNGSKDLQVPVKENLPVIKKILKDKNKLNKFVELENLNHLFQTAITGSPNEYGQNEETFSPKALDVIGQWLKEVTK